MVRLALVMALLLACSPPESTVVEREGEPPVHNFRNDDREMAIAISAARESVGDLIERLDSLRSEGAYVSVKAPVRTGESTEHIWLEDLDFHDGRFHGRLGNVPVDAGRWSLGDAISLPPEEISDWMVVRQGQLFGGFTIFVIRRHMTEEQRRDLDASLDFSLPESPRPLERAVQQAD